jgi:elongation factor Ts
MSVKDLRKMTGMPIALCGSAWKDSGEDMEKALELLKAKGANKALRLQDRETKAGFIGLYRHHDGRSYASIEVLCETDFVANNAEFRNFAENVAMQVATHDLVPSHTELHDEDFLVQPGMTVKQALDSLSTKTGEKIKFGAVVLGRV